MFLCSFAAHSIEPLVKEPSFLRLSTENGLSQNTINAMALDSEGFLWLATESGLNRFDGYKNQIIPGPNNEFVGTPISYVFQDSKQNLWVSSYTQGVFLFNLATNTAQTILRYPTSQDDQVLQLANFISEDPQGRIILSMDQGVYRYSYQTQEIETLYLLPEDLVAEGQFIRSHLITPSSLFIGTTKGLYGLAIGQNFAKPIRHIPNGIAPSIDNQNVKILQTFDGQTLWVGTVEGLYTLPFNASQSFINEQDTQPQASLKVANRNIWNIALDSPDLLYLATDKGLFSYQVSQQQLAHIFLPTDSRNLISSDVLKGVVIDKNHNLWLGSENDGAMYWLPKSTLFTNVFNIRGGRDKKILSHNNVWSLHQAGEQLWVGTRNGLNLYHLNNGQTQQFLVSGDEKAQYSASSIAQIGPAENGNLWLNTGSGILHFNSQTGQTTPLQPISSDNEVSIPEYVWDMFVTQSGELLLVFQDGFFRYSQDTGKLDKLEQLSATLNPRKTIGFIKGVKPNTTFVSAYGQLWEMDNQSYEINLVHETPIQQRTSKVFPSDLSLDKNQTLWVTYSGYGLIGLDANNYQQKYFFDQENLLPTNTVFDMQQDAKGNIWMGSNAGLLKFDPINHHLQKFDSNQGLSNSEFNSYSSLKLTDGRMVYGSPKGLIIFDPKKLEKTRQQDIKVNITDISLASNTLRMPIKNLDGQHLELNHDDFGISIGFSTLEYENINNTRYLYQLKGENNFVYPITKHAEVTFPKLEPGQYQFSVVAFDPVSGKQSSPAKVNIRVNYAPWASPLAYSLYVLLGLVGLSLVWMFFRANNKRLYKAHQEALLSKNKLTLALHASKSGIWEFQTREDKFLTSRIDDNLTYKKAISFEQHLGMIQDRDKKRYQSAWQEFLTQKDAELDISYRIKGKDKKWHWYRDVGKVVEYDKDGKPLLVTGTYTNITDSVADQKNLRLYGEAFKYTLNWVIIYNDKYFPIAFNNAFKKFFDIAEDADVPKEMAKLWEIQTPDTSIFWNKMLSFKAGKQWRGEDKIRLPNGNICDVLVHIHAVASVHEKDKIEHFLVIISDITEQKATEAKLLTLANYDALTGLPNRTLLLDRIERGLEHARRHEKSMAVFFVDLDKFKQVNDSLGHKAGDELLAIIAKRLENKLRKEDTVARLGGDEFVIMIEEVNSAEAISSLVTDISKIIDIPVSLRSQTVSVSSSIGIAMYPGDGQSAEELLKNADIAMYHAKEQGRSNFQFFTQQMDEKVKNRLKLENQLKKAHQAKRFLNYYQPIFNTQSQKIEGFEILMRWPIKNGMVPPDKFIPVSEELGLIENMTLDAFERAMPVLKAMRKDGFEGYLSVNLSAKHFESQSSIDKIMLLLEEHFIPVNAIRFEITESALMRDYDKALKFMTQIQEKGFLIALDDFGTGFSSLKYLKEFPINIIKVDKSFVDDIGKNQNNEAIILTTLSMAKQLNMSCIAEGIETQEQVEFFKTNQCHHLQGYFFSKPVPSEDIPALLDKTWPNT
ncbi:EAL domain-containing protein [Paraglaciecola aestuariivivens]